MTLMLQVDAIVIVTRLGVVRQPKLKEMRRMLTTSSVSALGFIVTGERTGDDYRREYYGHQDLPNGRQQQVG